MTAIKVEALTDQRLPEGGPGRAENGNSMFQRLIFLVSRGRKNQLN